MDEDGYPTEETLQEISNWDPMDFDGLAAYLTELWIYENRASLEDRVLRLSTGGWSGHEDLIAALPPMWRTMHFYANRSGGHWVFAHCRNGPEKLDW